MLRIAVVEYLAGFLLGAHCFLLTYLMSPVTVISAVLLLGMCPVGPGICNWSALKHLVDIFLILK